MQDLEEIIEKELGEKKEIRREEKKDRREEYYKKKSREENISMLICLSLSFLILGFSLVFQIDRNF
ncbi:MAG: hypothetical protein QQN49_02860 [Nitrosopumilus sp.]|nr:hypothetical protein [Nitrososphaerota archaeon]